MHCPMCHVRVDEIIVLREKLREMEKENQTLRTVLNVSGPESYVPLTALTPPPPPPPSFL